MLNLLYSYIEHLFTYLRFGMRGKLITLFVFIKVAPLFLLALLAWSQFEHLGDELRERTEVLAHKSITALTHTGDIAVADAIKALDYFAQEDIERLTTDVAKQVASFLYARDADIRYMATLPPSAELYQHFLDAKTGRLVKQGAWTLSPDKKRWLPVPSTEHPSLSSSNQENSLNFHYRPPEPLDYEERPLFLEATYLTLDGQEIIKATMSDRMPKELKNVSKRENTYVRAESYFEELKKLKPGEIYVSDVIGEYVPSRIIGIFSPDNAAKAGIPFKPEDSAFAGKENPLGKRFQGIVRWATPVVEQGTIVGYVTLALNHDHIMAFVDHVTPTKQRYTELSDAYEGNYAFIWDYKGRSIAHPRHHSIVGYQPETGDPEIPWLEESIYNRWIESGKPYTDFIADEETFVQQSIRKRPASQLTQQGLVGLDCRYLNFAPQCTGWFDLTSKGGSGSFNILWSGLRKLTTAATIPYFTGQYADSPRGFGFVAIGAGLEDFHRPATETGLILNALIDSTDVELKEAVEGTKKVILDNLTDTAISLSLSTVLMILFVVLIAVWMASVFTRRITSIIHGISRFRSGERQFRFNAPVKDEMGVLCDSFDSMANSLEQSVQGTLVITDPHTNVIYANNAFLAITQKTLSDVLGKPYASVTFFTKDNPLQCFLEKRDCDVDYHTPTQTYHKAIAEEYSNEQGEITGYLIVTTDVTSMIETQRKSEEQRILLDIIFSASPDIIWYKNTEGVYLAVNPRFASLCGKSPEEIVGHTADEILDPKKALETKLQDRLIAEHHAPICTEEEARFVNGNVEIIEAVRSPIFDTSGNMVGILGVARDITERTQIAKTLRQTQHQLEQAVSLALQANEAKSQFLANMSHEIRTPMNAILGFSYLALQEDMPDAQREMFLKIQSAATGLLGIINDILDFSKIEARKLDFDMAAFSLQEHLCGVFDILKFKTTEKQIDLCVHIAPEVLEHDALMGDAARLRQILINLLGNAIKFTEKGGVVLEVEVISCSDQQTELLFSVHDTGIGIASQALTNLFQPFSQADGSITRRFGGTGLGLVISKELVELMGGQMHVESLPDFGSVFSFTLPFAFARADCPLPSKNLQPSGKLTTLKGKRVLLVEDNDINQLIAQSILEQAGIEVTIASNGIEAVEAVSGQNFDLVLMDIQMPIMDGLEATRRIRSLPEIRPDLPIIAMTAHAMSDDHNKSLSAGMNAHITKPINPDTLFVTLRYWMP